MFLDLLFAWKRRFSIKTQFLQKIIDLVKLFKASPLILLSALSFLLAIFLSIYPNNIFQAKKYHLVKNVKGTAYVPATHTPTPIQSGPTDTPTSIQSGPPVILTATPTPTPIRNSSTSSGSSTPTPTPTQSGPTKSPIQIVNMQIIDPDGKESFTVNLNPGNNLCDNLNEAKQEGKIKSVNMTWYASYNSYYVNEINGFNNNWTVNLNGEQPKVGCSQIKPNSNDTIVWKFG